MAIETAARTPTIVVELYVSDLDESKHFYTACLGFDVAYERPEEAFACLRLGEAQLMLESPESFAPADSTAFRDGRWIVAPTERPFGRGMNLQIQVASVDAIAERLADEGRPVVLDPHERTYAVPDGRVRHRVLLIQDPDGYLVRICEVLRDDS